jgi:tetratricopeptide (TPR) repeat protein
VRRVLIALFVIASALPAEAKRGDRNAGGDAMRAARMIGATRYADAATLIADLERRVPDDPDVKWLRAELAFHQGRYADALDALRGVPDSAGGGQARTTRALVQQTLAVVNTFLTRTSPKGHFEIRYAPGLDELIVDLAADVLDKAHDAYAEDFGWKPSGPVRVELVGAPKDLALLSPLTEQEIETTGTIALCKYGKLMVVSPRATVFGYPWMDTLAHEYVHLVVSQLSHDEVPVWLHEGLARFEQTRWRSSPGKVDLAPAERQLLAAAARKGRLIGLDEMHPSMAKLPSNDAAALAYAEVVTLVAWLHGKIGYAGLRDVIARQKDGRSARRAIAEVVDMPFPKIEREWKATLRGVDPGAAPRIAHARRIHFAKGGRKDDDLGVDQVASGKARKHARLAGMLRARGMLDGAVIEYEKALAAGGGDPFLTGKLARTLLDLGRADRAGELAAPLVAADEGDVVAAVTLGMARAAGEQWADAAAAFEIALRVSPFDPVVRCGLADAYEQTAHAAAARERSACERLRAWTP